MKKGLRDRNSPTCTLSQNGYGEKRSASNSCGKTQELAASVALPRANACAPTRSLGHRSGPGPISTARTKLMPRGWGDAWVSFAGLWHEVDPRRVLSDWGCGGLFQDWAVVLFLEQRGPGPAWAARNERVAKGRRHTQRHESEAWRIAWITVARFPVCAPHCRSDFSRLGQCFGSGWGNPAARGCGHGKAKGAKAQRDKQELKLSLTAIPRRMHRISSDLRS